MPDNVKAVVMRFTLPETGTPWKRGTLGNGGRMNIELPEEDVAQIDELYKLAKDAKAANLPLVLVARVAQPHEVEDIPFWRAMQERK